jgi:hypothetical protein
VVAERDRPEVGVVDALGRKGHELTLFVLGPRPDRAVAHPGANARSTRWRTPAGLRSTSSRTV